jgi:hypothetical protein
MTLGPLGCSLQGCEDVACCTKDLLGSGPARTPALLFGLYDGHCGAGAAEEAAAALPAQLRARLLPEAGGAELAAGAGAGGAWADAFLATDAGLAAEEGCTATALLAWADAQGGVCLQARAWLLYCADALSLLLRGINTARHTVCI